MLAIFKHTLGAKGWLKAWAIYLMAFPFYFLPAGSAQPSDFYIALVISAYLLTGGLKMFRDNREAMMRFLRFCLYLTVVNFVVYISLLGGLNRGLPWFVMSAFYFYNLLVMAFAMSLYKKYGKAFLYTTLYACVAAAILQIVISNILGTTGDGIRGTLFFTNPNQLGYYSLCGLSIVLVLETALKIPKLIVYGSMLLFAYLAVVSVSKAAIGALLILVAVYLIVNGVFTLRNLALAIVVGGVGLYAYSQTAIGTRFDNNLEIRAANEADRDEAITEWEYRGYDRISNHPEYLILGAGEGGYNRFDTFIDNHEIHSSIGTIIFCYGIPGTILFISFLLALFKKLPWYFLIYALPLFSYGLTHMGLRFTIFWVALVMFPIIRMEIKKKNYFLKKKRLETIKNHYRPNVPALSVAGSNEVHGFKGN